MVNPIMEAELKCPFCLGGFLEEMDSSSTTFNESESTSERALSLWAPILLGMMGNNNQRSRRRSRRHFLEDNTAIDDDNEHGRGDRELVSTIRRRRTSSTAVLQLLHGISETENDRIRGQERRLLINPFNQDPNLGPRPLGSLGDYFTGPGLDLLLQHLAENDPNRHGTLPTQKAVVDALPTVKIEEILQCPICLDEFEAASEGKEMPCKHKFHNGCIVPWLELHSSCPMCRFQLPADEAKPDSESRINDDNHHGRGNSSGESRFTLPWPLNTLTSASTSHRSSASSSGGPGDVSQADGN